MTELFPIIRRKRRPLIVVDVPESLHGRPPGGKAETLKAEILKPEAGNIEPPTSNLEPPMGGAGTERRNKKEKV
ncbi:MAG: hypothetical protein MUF81_14550 [Verrucomicrobia bacterium]|nr:hypothetical protein [Verrucomicrobiota bacterium]